MRGFHNSWRIVLIVLLALAAWDPAWLARAGSSELIIMVDRSDSVDAAAVASALSQVTRQLAAGPVELRAPPFDSIDGPTSDIEAALRVGLRREAPLLLVTDGHETAGDARAALLDAAARRIPVWLSEVPRAAPQHPYVHSLRVPPRVVAGAFVPLVVDLAGPADHTVAVMVWADGTRVAHEEVDIHARTLTRWRGGFNADAGTTELQVELREVEGSGAVLDRRYAVINVEDRSEVLYVAAADADRPLARSLRAGGWSVRTVVPERLSRSLAGPVPVDVVVLDDVPISRVPAPSWRVLTDRVRQAGLGLVVLGGGNSFGAGGYRDSILEDVLPVTAEAASQDARAAVLFVIDNSGSMAGGAAVERIDYARQGVLQTARMVSSADLVGLVAFDRIPSTWLPLAAYEDPARALAGAWTRMPSGGTRIQPALREAVRQLGHAPVPQRLMMLVTDGLAADGLALDTRLREQIRATGVRTLVFAVGEAAGLAALQRFVDGLGGDARLFRVRERAELPRFMNRALGSRRLAVETGSVAPREVRPVPFLPVQDQARAWPELDGYLVTRARPTADVYLRTDSGDPLLAAHQIGLGRVAVLPGGLGERAGDWLRWSEWDEFAGGLVEWVRGSAGADLYLSFERIGAGSRVLIDALAATGGWSAARRIQVAVRDPVGRMSELDALPLAPGRYHAELPPGPAGRWGIRLDHEGNRMHHEFAVASRSEHGGTTSAIGTWLDSGLIRRWPQDTSDPFMGYSFDVMGSTRENLLIASLVLFCVAQLIAAGRSGTLRYRSSGQMQ